MVRRLAARTKIRHLMRSAPGDIFVSIAHYSAQHARIVVVQRSLPCVKLLARILLSCLAVFWSHIGASAVFRNDEPVGSNKVAFTLYTYQLN